MMDTEKDYDYMFKLVIVGDAGVGKSSLVLRFADDIYKDEYAVTIMDFKIRTVEMDGKVIKLHIWDTAGCERFRCLTPNYYKGADGVILVYDCTVQKSFEIIKSWLDEIKYYGGDDIKTLLVGNKSDLALQKVVDYFTANKYAKELGITFLETSAKNATNVEQAFMMMVAEMKSKVNPLLHEANPRLRITNINSRPVDNTMTCGYC